MKKGSYNCHFIGNVNNPKVVLIHGMGFYWEKCFTPIIEALELEYCLIIPELEGHHNKSEKTDIKIAGLCESAGAGAYFKQYKAG